MADHDQHDDEPSPETMNENTPVLDANALFGEHREICLELDGVRYRLRITRRNKLILQK